MLKSIFAALSGAFGLTFRVILLVIVTCAGMYCLASVLLLPFRWEGAVQLVGLAVCVLLFRLILGRRKKDLPPEEDAFDYRSGR